MKTTRKIIITTRHGSGDCYVARVQGLGITASCTSSPRNAAENAAIKVRTGLKKVDGLSAEGQFITLKAVFEGPFGVGTYRATWEEEDRVKVGHSYVVNKSESSWHGLEVSVISANTHGDLTTDFTCALASEVVEALRKGRAKVSGGTGIFTAEQLD